MTESNQLAQDLQFVRKAVEARDGPQRPGAARLIIWATYCLICIPTYDFFPNSAARINLIGLLPAALISPAFRNRAIRESGQIDRALVRRLMLHWIGGVALLLAAVFGFLWRNPGASKFA